MNPTINPYTPGAGTPPGFLAGRDELIYEADVILKRVKGGYPANPLMLYGLRGVGKTVLLNHFLEMARKESYICEEIIEISENDNFQITISKVLRKILISIHNTEKIKDTFKKALGVFKSFSISVGAGDINLELGFDIKPTIGQADSGRFEDDLKDIFLAIGESAVAYNKQICILLDEVQYLKESDMAALLAALHKISQKKMPFVTFCAGLPSVIRIAGDAKTYSERLFDYKPIEHLEYPENEKAITEPAKKFNVSYQQDAINEVMDFTKGYPYFIQELGKHVWDIAETVPITKQDVDNAKRKTLQALDKSFFKSRLDKVTEMEMSFMHAMAILDDAKKQYNMSDVARKMGKKINQISPTRANLIHKGLVYTPGYGYIAFTVPLFDDFLRRDLGEYKPKLNKSRKK